jgi:hypothetical protein
MTTDHERTILREALTVLHDVGLPHVEWMLYAALAPRVVPRPALSDLQEALQVAEKNQWVIGITGKLGEKKWAITDAGEAVRREFK